MIITLEGKRVEVVQPPFGRLRKIIAEFNKMRGLDSQDDEFMSHAACIIGLLLNKNADTVDEMTINIREMIDVLSLIPEICGLVQGDPESGEALKAVGISSTAT